METDRSLEEIWLCQKASPSYKTITDFRKNNVKALKAAQREFLELCKELSLFGGPRAAVDGTYLKDDASTRKIYTGNQSDGQIEDYYRQLEQHDADEVEFEEFVEVVDLKAKLEKLVECQQSRQELQEGSKKAVTGKPVRWIRMRIS